MLIELHAKACRAYADAYERFRAAYVELRAVERAAANSNVAVHLSATFPNSTLPDPRQFRHSTIVPLEPWDGWKIAIDTRAITLTSHYSRKVSK